MSKFDPNKLNVELKDNITSSEPIIPRRYTLTHSDITAELFLTIAKNYDYSSISIMRDEVLGEWMLINEHYFYFVNLHLDGHDDTSNVSIRNEIFIRELPLALQAIRYGDREFFNNHIVLDLVPILVYFNSKDSKYNRIENLGTFSNYNITREFRDYIPTSFIKLSNSLPNTHDLDIYINGILVCENLEQRNSTAPLPYVPGNYIIDILPNKQSTSSLICTNCQVIPNHISNIYIIEDNSKIGVYNIPQPITQDK